MQSLLEGSSIIVVCGNAMLSPQAKVKQFDGPCGGSKSQGKYSFVQLRKGMKVAAAAAEAAEAAAAEAAGEAATAAAKASAARASVAEKALAAMASVARRLYLDCSRPIVTPPSDKAAEANELVDVWVASDENAPPNFSSPCRGGTLWKRKSASPCGLNDCRPSPSLPPSSSPPLACSTAPLKKCKGGYAGNFGSALAFATKAY